VIRPAQAEAPVRVDFAGGWTDVPPFSAREGGVVVSAAVRLYARALVEPSSGGYRLRAEDLGASLELPGDALPRPDGPLALLKAALRVMGPAVPLSLTTRCEAPVGSGLGGSGALDVAMVAALAAAMGLHLPPRELAERAWRLEALEARVPGGKQDQFSAALGGFNLLRLRDPDVAVEPIPVPAAVAAELERRVVLCYTGASRFSGNTIGRVMAAYERGERRVVDALRRMKVVAAEMAEALPAGDLTAIGRGLAENWRLQQALDGGMCTPEMARLEAAAAAAGALGGKAAGSGAGGCMFFLAGDDVGAVRAAAQRAGATLLPVAWATEGVRAW
jgi:D-glycero-alpha-D-manno-heptose-7-phosphate kinase